jgi:hypothetical protein
MNWRLIAVLIVVWSICTGFGAIAMLQYEQRPSVGAQAPDAWPTAATIERDQTRPTLVLFLHPKCPCSRATLAELERLIAVCEEPFALRMVFVTPEAGGEEWRRTALVRKAENIEPATVSFDAGGKQAALFGARTSGQALLYATDGQALFRGGLTPSRGHEGDNAGRSALSSLLNHRPTDCTKTVVFGCSLVQPSSISTQRPRDASADSRTQ